MRASNLNFALLTEAQKDALATSLALDLASSVGVNQRAIQNASGEVGRVSLSAGSLVASGNLYLGPGVTIEHVQGQLDGASLRSRVVASLTKAQATDALTGDGSLDEALGRVKVTASAEALRPSHCFVLGTRFEPSLPSDNPRAVDLRACQSRCAALPNCAYFTFFRETQGCLLQDAVAVPSFDSNATAGPARCPPVPAVGEPADEEMQAAIPSGGPSLLRWAGALAAAALGVATLCLLLPRLWRCCRRQGQGNKYRYTP
eukprot:CAMPEP_0198556416 /NCGR_PEP_ID=MMETSP1462-20131121/86740_1 /TAXON_ID=1333877 /ORGANISM="Brandtodinium nutriculum, Strain RCC3387" /LENGTH=259 /DNA_ID=CAMNT_0044287165 /DNA_START=41 /DNA_END=817 /DNA_ORIENTATION=-